MNLYFKLFIIIGFIILISGRTIAQTYPAVVPLELRAQFNGQYDYKIIGNTLNEFDNWQNPPPPCQILTESSALLNLDTNQSVVAAYLYWSGIGDGSFDNSIKLNGDTLFADEINIVDPEQSNLAFYFGSFKDISELVQLEGNGSYIFSDLDLNPIITTYCTNGLYYSGWSILVIYEDATLPTQQVNIYDGFASVYGQPFSSTFSTTIDINSLNVVNTQNARMGFLAWNGSPNLFSNESISFNGNLLSNPPLNPIDNPFNGTNSYTGANDLWNMDLDVFDISSYIELGDIEANLTFNSLFNRFIQNVVTVTRSELPDATAELVNISNQTVCDDRDITLEISVNNFESSKVLPANTPVSIFVLDENNEEVFLNTIFTQNELAIDESETQFLNLTIPDEIPEQTTLILKANTLQDGENPINEANLLNNSFEQELIIPNTPEITNPPNPLNTCGDLSSSPPLDLSQNNLSSLGFTSPEAYNIQYYTSNSDAQNNINPIPNPNTFELSSNAQPIFIRVENALAPACFSVASFEARYNAIPEIQQTLNLEQCQIDEENSIFDLTANNAAALGISNPATTTISYFENLADAENNTNAILNPEAYTPENNSQTLFVRAENSENPSCFSTASFEITRFPVNINSLSNLSEEACVALNETAVFDLTQNTNLALGNQNPQDYSVSYHQTEIDAQNGSSEIPNPTSFPLASGSQEIWVRLANTNASPSCVSVDSFLIEVIDIAVINNVNDLNIQACIFPGESAVFDLTENSSTALGNQNPQNYNISYHVNETDATNGNNPIENPSEYENLSNPQTIWLRLENSNSTTVCYDVKPFQIEVFDAAPINFSPEMLEVCDSNNDGFAEFDLSQSIAEITLNNPEITVSFHENQSDAENNSNPLPTSFTNTQADNQSIFFRTQETGNGCSFVGSLEVAVLASPELDTSLPTFTECALSQDTANFDLTQIGSTLILNNQAHNFDVAFFLSENDAQNNINSITNPSNFNNTTNPQNLWIRVSDGENCATITSFELGVFSETIIQNTQIDDIELCSETTEILSASIDLTAFDESIQPNPTPNTSITYYQGQSNFDNQNPIENPSNFEVNSSTTSIIAALFNEETLCRSPEPIAFTIQVNPLPAVDVSSVDGDVICVDAQSNQIISSPTLDTQLNETDYSFEWFLNGERIANSGSSLQVEEAGFYEVEVTNMNTNCQSTSFAEITSSSVPEFDVEITSSYFARDNSLAITNIQGTGVFEFSVNGRNWRTYEGEGTLNFSGLPSGEVLVIGRDLARCGERIKRVTFISYPKFFTPNNDGYNDRWEIEDLPNATVYIFDRFGKLLKTFNTSNGSWDGTYNGKAMPSNDYWFNLEYTDPNTGNTKTFKSNFTLKR